MLKRLVTGLLLAPIVLLLIVFSSASEFAFLCIILFTFSFKEGLSLAPINSKSSSFVLLSLFIGVLLAVFYFITGGWLLVFSFYLWLLLLVLILAYPRLSFIWGHSSVVLTLISFVLVAAFKALIQLKLETQGYAYLIYLMGLVWAADSGAYFSGKAFGSHKLITKVSPGKTLEGLFGGLCSVLIVAAVARYYFLPQQLLNWYLLSAIVFISSVFGDLFISMLKRRVKLKDTGALLPGHGGLLDRFDSLLPASVFFLVSAKWLNLL